MSQSEELKKERNSKHFFTHMTHTIHEFNGHTLSVGCFYLEDIIRERREIIRVLKMSPTHYNTDVLVGLASRYLNIRLDSSGIATWFTTGKIPILDEIIEAYNKDVMEWIEEVQDKNPDVDFTPLFLNEIPVEMAKTKSAAKST